MGYGFDENLQISPLEESSDSVISELSSRADYALSDALEMCPFPPVNPRTFMYQLTYEGSNSPEHNQPISSMSGPLLDHFKENTYEELDSNRSKNLDMYNPEDVKLSCYEVEQPRSSEAARSALAERSKDKAAKIAAITQKDGFPEETEKEQPGVEPTVFLEDDSSSVQQMIQLDRCVNQTKLARRTPRISLRKVHPDGLVFPRIITSVPILPDVPEERELSSRQLEDKIGIKPYVNPTYPPSKLEFRQLDYEPKTIKHLSATEKINLDKSHCSNCNVNVLANKHKLVIQGWESLISSCEDSD